LKRGTLFGKGDQFWQPKVVWGDQIWQLKVIWADHFWLPKMVPGPLFDRTTFGVTVPANTSSHLGLSCRQYLKEWGRKEGLRAAICFWHN